ncbi:hypothetical protein [Streptococcus mitis]|uniref:hypothetical protein n=1 Tax=Streptococcus mitis TaxID=28037 RepID=UPI001934AA87|nr:hypothetical protein [Streptococcus mitis]
MSKEELLELLKKSLQDALDSIQGRDKQELNEEKRTELKKEIEKVFMQALLDKGKPKEILDKVLNDKDKDKDEFLKTFSPWHKKQDEDSGLIKEFVNSINNPDSNNDFSWLDILDTDKQWMEQADKETKKEIKNKSKHVNMRYQIPTHFHGNIDNAVIFHCMENPRGYLGEYEDSDIDKGLESIDLVEYFGKTYKLLNEDSSSSKKSVEKIQSILKDYSRDDMPDIKDIIKERYKLDKIGDEEITNIIYSDKSNLSRELDSMFAEEEEFFKEEYILKKHSNSKKPVLSEKYYYIAQYYAQLLGIDGKNMRNLKDKRGDENTEERKKARKIAEKICNLEIYPFSCKDPKLGNDGIGEKILLNSDLSRLGAYIVLRRIYKYLVNENPQKPLFVFRKYDRAWEKLFNKIFEEVGVKDNFLQDLESHFFYCQTSQQGGGITSGNVISVRDFKALEFLKELAFRDIFDLITEKED